MLLQDLVQDISFHSPLGKSDHAVLKIDCKLHSFTDICAGEMNYGKGDYENLRKSLDNIDWIQSLGSCNDDVDRMWEFLKNTQLSRIEQYIPVVSNFSEWKKSLMEMSS